MTKKSVGLSIELRQLQDEQGVRDTPSPRWFVAGLKPLPWSLDQCAFRLAMHVGEVLQPEGARRDELRHSMAKILITAMRGANVLDIDLQSRLVPGDAGRLPTLAVLGKHLTDDYLSNPGESLKWVSQGHAEWLARRLMLAEAKLAEASYRYAHGQTVSWLDMWEQGIIEATHAVVARASCMGFNLREAVHERWGDVRAVAVKQAA